MLIDKLDTYLRTIPDFPKEGIQFKDITPLLKDPALCNEIMDALVEPYKSQQVDVVVGVESRGFLFGLGMADRLGCEFALVRKKGKLPAETIEKEYELEYGSAVIEMHVDSIREGQNVLVHDDLLATGGTALAARDLVQLQKGNMLGYSFVIELEFLGASQLLGKTGHVHSLIKY